MRILLVIVLSILYSFNVSAQSIVGCWESIEYSCWSAFPDEEDEGGIGDYLEIKADGTYYMKYRGDLEDWGTWQQNGNKLIFTVTESTDDAISLTGEVTIIQLTEDILEWELDYGYLRIHEKFKRINSQPNNLMIGDESIETVRQKSGELKQTVSEFFESFLHNHLFENESWKVWIDAQQQIFECFEIFENEMNEYENGSNNLKDKLETHWEWLSKVTYCLNDLQNYTFEVTITVHGEGYVELGSMQLKNETKSFCWCYGKATDSNLYYLCDAFGLNNPRRSGLYGELRIVPLTGYQVISITQNGKELDSSTNVFAEGEIFVVFSENTSIDHPMFTSPVGKGKYYTLDGCMQQNVPKQNGVYIVNGRKVLIK